MRLLLDTGVVGQICHAVRGNLWAWARRTGKPTDVEAGLDGNVLIAAQAVAEQAVVLTTNPRHFEPIVRAIRWDEVIAE